MTFPEHLPAMIAQRLAEFVASADPRLETQRRLAIHLQALPLYADLGACIAIRPSGELISVHSDQDWCAPTEWTHEIESTWRTVALATGSATYPELKALLPARGALDVDCPECTGAGRRPELANAVCGACLGLGWRSQT